MHLCDQVSALLLIEPKTTRQVFLGEPVDEVMAMVKWALKHEGEAEFAPEKILPAWARKRGRAIEGRRTAELRSVDTTMGPDGHRALSRTPRNGTRSARAWIALAARDLVLSSKPWNCFLRARYSPDGALPLGQGNSHYRGFKTPEER